jgi:Fic-DOC domain mobile mystery protein B/predicted DNA-binding mobile mystery protein A
MITMKERRKPHLAREQLDHFLAELNPLGESRRPVRGWLRAIRSGLGMSGVDLARRLGVKPPRVVEMEKSELDGAITLKVLARAADAMGCSLVYALIPRAGSLEQTLRNQAGTDSANVPGFPAGAVTGLSDPEDASSPLSSEESGGLRLSHISTRGELDSWERQSVLEAEAWAFSRVRKDWLAEKWIRTLHGKMFGQVWKGAGSFRDSEGARGAPSREIAARLQELCENVRHWAKARVYAPDEACARFYHRLLSIRPFARGNGRLARLMADLLSARVYGLLRFTWGTASAGAAPEVRKRYHHALRSADARDFKPLMAFIRS